MLSQETLYVTQKKELAELFGFETRNKYAISDAKRQSVGFAAEEGKGFVESLFRSWLGHFRRFSITFFDQDRRPLFVARHPFSWFFQRLEISDAAGTPIGTLQQRFAFFSRRFDVCDARGQLLFEMRSGFFRAWTFPFFRGETQVAVVEKKFGNVLTELFTDADNFRIQFASVNLSSAERTLIIAASVFIDLQYFEAKAD
jgi:uncharacterized protein YxjI